MRLLTQHAPVQRKRVTIGISARGCQFAAGSHLRRGSGGSSSVIPGSIGHPASLVFHAGFRPRATRSFCFGKRTQNQWPPGGSLCPGPCCVGCGTRYAQTVLASKMEGTGPGRSLASRRRDQAFPVFPSLIRRKTLDSSPTLLIGDPASPLLSSPTRSGIQRLCFVFFLRFIRAGEKHWIPD